MSGDPIRIALLGATGSIGRSTIEIVRRHPGRFEIVAASANRRASELAELVEEFSPAAVALADTTVEAPDGWARGAEAVRDLAARDDVDVVVNAVVGAAGLLPTLTALEAGHRVALANK